MHITLLDSVGDPVCGVMPVDVVCTFYSEAVGWSIASVSVEANTVSLEVCVATDCTDGAVLEANIAAAGIVSLPLKVLYPLSRVRLEPFPMSLLVAIHSVALYPRRLRFLSYPILFLSSRRSILACDSFLRFLSSVCVFPGVVSRCASPCRRLHPQRW